MARRVARNVYSSEPAARSPALRLRAALTRNGDANCGQESYAPRGHLRSAALSVIPAPVFDLALTGGQIGGLRSVWGAGLNLQFVKSAVRSVAGEKLVVASLLDNSAVHHYGDPARHAHGG